MVTGSYCRNHENPAPWEAAVYADKGLFLLLLYDKAIRCMDEALELMAAGDMLAKGERLVRAQDIVLVLSEALDKGAGEIADNLERLYLYVYRRLIRGNVRLDREAVVEARHLMQQLQSAWQTIILGRDSAVVPTEAVSVQRLQA
ncbi:MAG: flagellar export chaperone FliS [Gemmatimonadota bacterium]